MMHPGELLRKHRERIGQPMYWVSFHSGIPERTLWEIERGLRMPNKVQTARLLELVKMPQADRFQFLRGDVLTDREIDRIVLECAQAGCGYGEIQSALAAARAARVAAGDGEGDVEGKVAA